VGWHLSVDLRAREEALGVLVLPRQHGDLVLLRQRLREASAVLRDAAADGRDRADERDVHGRHAARMARTKAIASSIGMASFGRPADGAMLTIRRARPKAT
jgi:hypothetical protein